MVEITATCTISLSDLKYLIDYDDYGAPLKFIYSEMSTKFCKITIKYLSYVLPVKYLVEILQNFAAFSEYMNFNIKYILPEWT